jgi:hypothetical protein
MTQFERVGPQAEVDHALPSSALLSIPAKKSSAAGYNFLMADIKRQTQTSGGARVALI